MSNIRLGIIGAGTVTQTAHLPILSKMTDIDLVGICDTEKTRLRTVADKYHLDIRESEYRKFLERDDIDAVIIATPTDKHFEIGMAAVEAGKHVLIERPFTRTVEEAAALSKASAETEQVFIVGMNHRFRLDNMTLKNLVANGELGSIYSVNASWLNFRSTQQKWALSRRRSGGGVLIDLGIVMLDLVLWMLDFPKVVSISATMRKDKTSNVEDSAACFIRLENDITFYMNVSWTAVLEKPVYGLELVGTDGSATINPLKIHKIIADSPVNVTPILKESVSSIYKRSYEHELRHFAGAMKGLHPPISTASEAFKRMKLVEAAYSSAELQKEIQIQ